MTKWFKVLSDFSVNFFRLKICLKIYIFMDCGYNGVSCDELWSFALFLEKYGIKNTTGFISSLISPILSCYIKEPARIFICIEGRDFLPRSHKRATRWHFVEAGKQMRECVTTRNLKFTIKRLQAFRLMV